MKVLILRTISHNKIWEGTEEYCHYEDQGYGIIKKWEPNIGLHSLNEVNIAIGIYTKQYYSYPRAFTNSEVEQHPSLLKLQPIKKGSHNFGIDNNKDLKIYFSFQNKLNIFSRAEMEHLDNLFVIAKRKEINIDTNFTRYPSLCFTLDESVVKDLFSKFDKIIELK
jgi:hypothetical protein